MRDLGSSVLTWDDRLDRDRWLFVADRVARPHRALLGDPPTVGGLVWLGWNKALDAAEHEDPAVRAREAADLAWWVARAREALEAGLL